MLEQTDRNIFILRNYMMLESVERLSQQLHISTTRIYNIIKAETCKLIPEHRERIQYMCCKQIRDEFRERLL